MRGSKAKAIRRSVVNGLTDHAGGGFLLKGYKGNELGKHPMESLMGVAATKKLEKIIKRSVKGVKI